MRKSMLFIMFSIFIITGCQTCPLIYNPDYYQPAVRDKGPDLAPPTIQPYKVQ